MKDFEERVVEEKKELDAKIERLKEFLQKQFPKGVSESEWERLTRQLALMQSYSAVLGERIEAFV